ncbi:MAG: cytochrome P450 [Bacteroidota bacterium]
MATNTNYLAEYDAAPEDQKYPLVQKWMKTEPLPFFKQLRNERPILVTPECTLISHFTDIRDVLQMPKIFTVDLYKPKMGVTETEVGYLMAHDDDALHYREKSIMQGFLNRDDLPRVRKLIQDEGKKLLDDANGKIEIVGQYCRMVPAILVQEYFGLDGVDKADLIEWSFWSQYNTFHNQPFDLNPPELNKKIEENHAKSSEKLKKYLEKLIVKKLVLVNLEKPKNFIVSAWHTIKGIFGKKEKVELKDDMLTRMLRTHFAPEVEFPLDRLGANAGGLLIGSIETTSQAVAQTIEYFLQRPELLAKLKQLAQDSDLGKFDGYVWEALRFVPISPYMFRQTSQDYTVALGTDRETTIKKGTNVLTLTQSAMFDEYSYENAEEFIGERNWYHHFNFGFASHECLGKYVGMVMIPEMVRQVVLRTNIHDLGPINYKNGPFPEEYNLAWN